MRILLQLIEFFAVVSVADVAPITINGCILSWMHVREVDGPVFGLVRIPENRGHG